MEFKISCNTNFLCQTRDAHREKCEAKSRKYQGVFKVKSRVKTWQIRGIWSQQLEHKQVPKRGTEPGVRKDKRSLLASHTRYKRSMETTHHSVKDKQRDVFSVQSAQSDLFRILFRIIR